MDGYILAKRITKKFARTFYFASLFLKKEKRCAAYAVYAACRQSDESVDSASPAEAARQLEKLAQKIHSVYTTADLQDPILIALRQTVIKYRIPAEFFDQLLWGMRMDLEKNRYTDFDQLYDYCYKVAGVVGLVMLRIFGSRDKEAEKHAVEMGIAMQLTNILRDVREDYQRGRIYLPQDEMKRFGVSERDIAGENINDNFCDLMKFQIQRARKYYALSAAGIKMIEETNSRFVARAMADIYSGILTDIERNGYDIYTCRAHVSTAEKILAALKIAAGIRSS